MPKPNEDTTTVTPDQNAAPVTPEPAAPVTPTDPPAKPEVTAEEAQALAKDVADNLFGNPKKESKPEPEPPAPAEPEQKPAAEPEPKPASDPVTPPAEPEKPKAKKVKAKDPAPAPIDPEEIKALARDTAKAVMEENKVSAPQPPADDGLTEPQKRNLAVLRELEATNSKYAGIAEKTIKGVKEFAAYKAKWEAANPGVDFDPEDDEHVKVQEKLLPEYDQDDFDDARIAMKARAIVEQKERENQTRDAAKQVEQKIGQSVFQSALEMVEAVDPELAKHIKAGDEKAGEKMREIDPIATNVLSAVRDEMTPWIAELEKLSNPHLNYQINSANPVHVALTDYATECERFIKSRPASEQVDGSGRRFVTSREFIAMSPEQRRSCWRIEPDQLRTLIVNRFSHAAKAKIESLRKDAEAYAKSKGWVSSSSAPNQTPTPPPVTPPAPAPSVSKPAAPNMASSSDVIKASDSKLAAPVSLVDSVVTSLFGNKLR